MFIKRDLAHAPLEHRNARVDVGLPLLRRLVLGVLAQVAQLARALNLFRELHVQLALESVQFVFKSLEKLLLHHSNFGV